MSNPQVQTFNVTTSTDSEDATTWEQLFSGGPFNWVPGSTQGVQAASFGGSINTSSGTLTLYALLVDTETNTVIRHDTCSVVADAKGIEQDATDLDDTANYMATFTWAISGNNVLDLAGAGGKVGENERYRWYVGTTDNAQFGNSATSCTVNAIPIRVV